MRFKQWLQNELVSYGGKHNPDVSPEQQGLLDAKQGRPQAYPTFSLPKMKKKMKKMKKR